MTDVSGARNTRLQRGNVFAEKSVRSTPFRSHEKRCAGPRHGVGLGVPTPVYWTISRSSVFPACGAAFRSEYISSLQALTWSVPFVNPDLTCVATGRGRYRPGTRPPLVLCRRRVDYQLIRGDIRHAAQNASADSCTRNARREVDAMNRCARVPAHAMNRPGARGRSPHR